MEKETSPGVTSSGVDPARRKKQMSHFIMRDGEKNRFWIVKVIQPEDVKIAPGEMTLTVNVVGYARSMDAAKVKLLEEKMNVSR